MTDIAFDRRFKPPGPLGFGGAPLGNMFGRVHEDAAIGTLRVAWDEGIRYFDTAPLYGTGLSEHRFGRALRAYPRDEFVLSTKKSAGCLNQTLQAKETSAHSSVGCPLMSSTITAQTPQ
jgi:aryl-alcohol dehydrogenase-like predicted oxidoreductase